MAHKNTPQSMLGMFSFERAIAIILSICFIFFIYSFIQIGGKKLEHDAITVLEQLTNKEESLYVMSFQEIDEEKFETFASIEYVEMKEMLAIESDFCVFLEDSNGGTVVVNGAISGVGSDKIQINGVPCK